mgnify:CR=1 FL=1
MKLATFIIGLMGFVASTLVILTFMFSFYSESSLNVTIADNNDTHGLYEMQRQANVTKANIISNNYILANQTVGQPGATMTQGQLSEGDLMKSSLTALTKTPRYLDIFTTFLQTGFNSVGVSTDHPMFWFFTAMIGITVTLILIGVVFRNNIFV